MHAAAIDVAGVHGAAIDVGGVHGGGCGVQRIEGNKGRILPNFFIEMLLRVCR